MKATEKHVSEIKGAKRMQKVSNAERVESRGIDESNSIYESLHASSTWVSKSEVPFVLIIVHLRDKLVQTTTLDEDTPRFLPCVNGRMIRLISPLDF